MMDKILGDAGEDGYIEISNGSSESWIYVEGLPRSRVEINMANFDTEVSHMMILDRDEAIVLRDALTIFTGGDR